MTSSPTLPPPASSQAYCDVSALEAGMLDLSHDMFISNPQPGAVSHAPSLAFLLRHFTSGKSFVFDLGIRKDWENYPPSVVAWIKQWFPVSIPQDVAESLRKGGLNPEDVSTVCLSHVHFDHVGDTRPFTNSIFVLGAGSRTHFDPGYPADPSSGFASDLLPPTRTNFLADMDWRPIGPFPRAFDYYGDGSLYIVDAPGHLTGHVNVLARTSPDGAWIFLAGDSAHHWGLITGEQAISVGHPAHRFSCAHQDKKAAEEHLGRMRVLMKIPRVRILLAHDEPWYNENKHGPAFWPGKIPSL